MYDFVYTMLEVKREFDRRIWRSGNSYVVTIPSETVERFELEGEFVTISITDEDLRDEFSGGNGK